MNFASRITRLPLTIDTDHANEARAAQPGLDGPVSDLVAGAASCSPYLRLLLAREADWLVAALEAPEAALAGLTDGFEEMSIEQLGGALRQAKRRVALLTALADLAGVWPLEQVTRALTDFADRACDLAVKATVAAEIRRGKLPGKTGDDVATAAGMVAP